MTHAKLSNLQLILGVIERVAKKPVKKSRQMGAC